MRKWPSWESNIKRTENVHSKRCQFRMRAAVSFFCLFCFGALRNERRLLSLNLVSLTWFKVLINQSTWIGFNFSITLQVSESAMTAVSFFWQTEPGAVRVWMGVRGRSRLYHFFFYQERGGSNNSKKSDCSRHDYFSRKYDRVRSNIQVTFKVFAKTRKRQHLEGILM